MSNKIYRNSDFFIKSATVKQDGTKEGSGLFSGYASTFDRDRVDDIIIKGAFKNTINDRRRKNRRIPVLWQHNSDEVIGSISPYDLYEDSKGLKISEDGGRLNLNVEKAREAFALLKAGDIASMSIGFSIKDFEWKDDLRVIKSIELFEISLVAEPANLGAEVTDVKNVIREEADDKDKSDEDNLIEHPDKDLQEEEKHKSYIDAKTLEKIETKRQFETILRESGLFSIKAAKILSKNFEPTLRDAEMTGSEEENQRDVGNEVKGVDCEQLKSIHNSLRDLIKLSKGR